MKEIAYSQNTIDSIHTRKPHLVGRRRPSGPPLPTRAAQYLVYDADTITFDV